MPRIKTELLQEGMLVASDVKNSDQMLLLPAGSTLTLRLIGMMQSWGVTSVDVNATGDPGAVDPLAAMSPEALAKLSAEVRDLFWKLDDSDTFTTALLRVLMRRKAAPQSSS